jgi:arsenical pump membrane protein
MTPWIVAAVVVTTLALMLVRPRGISEAWVALGGAVALLATGAVDLAALPGIAGESADVLLFLLGMMSLTGIVERAGIFDLLAEACARAAGGSGTRLYVLLFVLGAVVTALLSLDVTVIVLTPVVYAVTRRRALDPLPFMFATAFVANTASLALPVSNLTNLLLYDALDLSFARSPRRCGCRTSSPWRPTSQCSCGSSAIAFPAGSPAARWKRATCRRSGSPPGAGRSSPAWP